MKLSGELDYRIRYDVEHDLFHAQNVFSDEYITPTFVEYVQNLEKENAELQHKVDTLQGFLDRDVEFDNLQKENAELKERHENVCKNLTDTHRNIREQLTNAKEIIKDLLSLCEGETDSKLVFTRAEQFLKNDGCPDVMCEDCTKEDCEVRQLGLVEVKK